MVVGRVVVVALSGCRCLMLGLVLMELLEVGQPDVSIVLFEACRC